MNGYRLQKFTVIFQAGNVAKGKIGNCIFDPHLNVIPDNRIDEVFSAVKLNRKNDFANPLMVGELIEAWEGLRLGKQEELF